MYERERPRFVTSVRPGDINYSLWALRALAAGIAQEGTGRIMLPASATLPVALGSTASGGSMASWGPFAATAAASLGLQGLGMALGSSNVKKQIHWQREQLQKGIQYRVADAKAAGLHPLYALGAQIQSPSPIQVDDQLGSGLQSMGQGLGQLSTRFQVPWERKMMIANLSVLASEVEKNSAMSQFYRSQAFDNSPGGSSPTQAMVSPSGDILSSKDVTVPPGSVSPKAPDMLSTSPGDRSVTAGRNPAMMKIDLDPRMPFYMPYTNEGMGESLENTPVWLMPSLVLQNAARYGERANDYLIDLGRFAAGKQPIYNWNEVWQPAIDYGPVQSRHERGLPPLRGGVGDATKRAIDEAWGKIVPYMERLKKSWNRRYQQK